MISFVLLYGPKIPEPELQAAQKLSQVTTLLKSLVKAQRNNSRSSKLEYSSQLHIIM